MGRLPSKTTQGGPICALNCSGGSSAILRNSAINRAGFNSSTADIFRVAQGRWLEEWEQLEKRADFLSVSRETASAQPGLDAVLALDADLAIRDF